MDIKQIFSKFIIFILLFSAGMASGYLYFSAGNRTAESNSPEEKNVSEDVENPEINLSNNRRVRVNMKINLLKDYVNLIFIPEKNEAESELKAEEMNRKVAAISDVVLKEKYDATGNGSPEEREVKILEFLNFLFDEIRNDLK